MTAQMERCWAVMPAAGIGSRMAQDIPKQYLQVAGRSVLEHGLAALLGCPEIGRVVVALHPRDDRGRNLPMLADSRVETVVGGAQRSDSVLAGLHVLANHAGPRDWVLVHDAARPCLSGEAVQRLISKVVDRGVGGILAEPLVDTVKLAGEDGRVSRTLDRSRLWRAQTPQMFRLAELRQALEMAQRDALPVTDEASAMEQAGFPVQLVEGARSNLKVTLPGDLELAAFFLDQDTGDEGDDT